MDVYLSNAYLGVEPLGPTQFESNYAGIDFAEN